MLQCKLTWRAEVMASLEKLEAKYGASFAQSVGSSNPNGLKPLMDRILRLQYCLRPCKSSCLRYCGTPAGLPNQKQALNLGVGT
jgi:hypothetical protein